MGSSFAARLDAMASARIDSKLAQTHGNFSMEEAIQNIIRNSWDRDDEGEYFTEEDSLWLADNDATKQWRDAYFNELIDTYMGSCNSLKPKDESFLEDFDMLGSFDEEIFNCESCGWWCETSEQMEDNMCQQCTDEEEE